MNLRVLKQLYDFSIELEKKEIIVSVEDLGLLIKNSQNLKESITESMKQKAEIFKLSEDNKKLISKLDAMTTEINIGIKELDKNCIESAKAYFEDSLKY